MNQILVATLHHVVLDGILMTYDLWLFERISIKCINHPNDEIGQLNFQE